MRVAGLYLSALRISVVGVDRPGASVAGLQEQSFDIVARASPDSFPSREFAEIHVRRLPTRYSRLNRHGCIGWYQSETVVRAIDPRTNYLALATPNAHLWFSRRKDSTFRPSRDRNLSSTSDRFHVAIATRVPTRPRRGVAVS